MLVLVLVLLPVPVLLPGSSGRASRQQQQSPMPSLRVTPPPWHRLFATQATPACCAVADAVGLPRADTYAGLTPSEKLRLEEKARADNAKTELGLDANEALGISR